MLNDVIESVVKALHTAFGDGYKFHTNGVRQGLKEPCFIVQTLKTDIKPMPMRRYLARYLFDIHYFPECSHNEEMFDVAERLTKALEIITLPNMDKLRGIDRSYEIVDGVLHFFITYNLYLMQQTDLPIMGTLDVNERVN